MSIELTTDAQKVAQASLKRFCRDEIEMDLNDLQAILLLAFILKEIGPSLYNKGVADAQAFMRDRVADVDGSCHEPEFAYWSKGSSVQRKR